MPFNYASRTILKVDGLETLVMPDGHIEVTGFFGYIPAKINSENLERQMAWHHTSHQVVEYLETKYFSYYILENGKPVYLDLGQTPDGTKYVKTAWDDTYPPQKLLKLAKTIGVGNLAGTNRLLTILPGSQPEPNQPGDHL